MPLSTHRDDGFDLQRIVRDTFVAEILYQPEMDSTNSIALEVCRRKEQQGTLLVLTAQQTAGRGRGSNQWWSAPGALTFSLLLGPSKQGPLQILCPKISLMTGLAACSAFHELLPDNNFSLKWPNDVHLAGRKICGILIESGPPRTDTFVVGVGVNVNNSFAEAPEELKPIATSLFDVTGDRYNLTNVLVCLLRQLEIHLSRLAAGDLNLVGEWQTRCSLTGKTVEVDTGKRRTTGVCQGIDETGALILMTEDGLARLLSGVVTRIW